MQNAIQTAVAKGSSLENAVTEAIASSQIGTQTAQGQQSTAALQGQAAYDKNVLFPYQQWSEITRPTQDLQNQLGYNQQMWNLQQSIVPEQRESQVGIPGAALARQRDIYDPQQQRIQQRGFDITHQNEALNRQGIQAQMDTAGREYGLNQKQLAGSLAASGATNTVGAQRQNDELTAQYQDAMGQLQRAMSGEQLGEQYQTDVTEAGAKLQNTITGDALTDAIRQNQIAGDVFDTGQKQAGLSFNFGQGQIQNQLAGLTPLQSYLTGTQNYQLGQLQNQIGQQGAANAAIPLNVLSGLIPGALAGVQGVATGGNTLAGNAAAGANPVAPNAQNSAFPALPGLPPTTGTSQQPKPPQ
jgi:hypothetical protein